MSPSPTEPITFEAALADLEGILRSLEEGSTSLEESLANYERGVGLLKRCYQQLRDAEQRITLLSGVDAEGRPVLQAFDHAATFDASKPEEKRRAPRAKPKETDSLY